jgi:hypothetical protein
VSPHDAQWKRSASRTDGSAVALGEFGAYGHRSAQVLNFLHSALAAHAVRLAVHSTPFAAETSAQVMQAPGAFGGIGGLVHAVVPVHAVVHVAVQ